jgi:hypothetical protein
MSSPAPVNRPSCSRGSPPLPKHVFVENDPSDAPLVVERYHNVWTSNFGDEPVELDLWCFRRTDQVNICSIIQSVYIVPHTGIVFICITALQNGG